MSEKLFHSVYKAASQMTIHRYAAAVGHVAKGASEKSRGKTGGGASSATPKKPARPSKKAFAGSGADRQDGGAQAERDAPS